MSRGCGYDGRPPPWPAWESSWRKPSSWASVSRPSMKARAYMPGDAWPWKKIWSPPPGWFLPRKKWLKPTS